MCLLLQTVSDSFWNCEDWGCVLECQLVTPECDNTNQCNLEGLSRWFDSGEEIVNFLTHNLTIRRVDPKKYSRRGVSCLEDHLVYDPVCPNGP